MLQTNSFTVSVLLYGDFLWLAHRVLAPIREAMRSIDLDLRIGCNSCGAATIAFVEELRQDLARDGVDITVIKSNENIHKYPMMRWLKDIKPMRPLWMWFDDDSFIVPVNGDYSRVFYLASTLLGTHDAVGQIWSYRLGGNQHLWVNRQKWCNKPIQPGKTVKFPQGAWWTVRSDVLSRFDWPSVELERKGGDVMFGELLSQNGLHVFDVGHRFDLVRINADVDGKHSGMATRGGRNPPPIGFL